MEETIEVFQFWNNSVFHKFIIKMKGSYHSISQTYCNLKLVRVKIHVYRSTFIAEMVSGLSYKAIMGSLKWDGPLNPTFFPTHLI